MYTCQLCGKNSQPRTPAHRITITTRSVDYSYRPKVNGCWKFIKERRKYVRTDDPGGLGFEAEREVIVCPECAAKWQAQE